MANQTDNGKTRFADEATLAYIAELEAELARCKEALVQSYTEELHNAFNAGIIRTDGMWIDGGMSDAEWLVSKLGLEGHVFHPESLTSRIPSAANDMVAALASLIKYEKKWYGLTHVPQVPPQAQNPHEEETSTPRP